MLLLFLSLGLTVERRKRPILYSILSSTFCCRISVAWCKKHEVPIEKVYNKTQREKFRWAIDMIMGDDEEYTF